MSVDISRQHQKRQIQAIPYSGASHILVRQSDAHILDDVQYSLPGQPPYAVLKDANNSELEAIGIGTLRMAGLQPTAYIFGDNKLAANLLGLAPFCDLGCTAVFKQRTFQLFQQRQQGPIMTGTRQPGQSLWQVAIPKAVTSDHIPPQFPHTRQGFYIEANFVSQQDNASYVRFVHAALGYPAPSTFLNAVTKGFINGPHQFHRLTAKMVRKHMPSTLATARGHLDKTQAKQPHKNSDAVSALLRHHTRQMQKDMQHNHSKLGLPPPLERTSSHH
jgi:hypothetical protein